MHTPPPARLFFGVFTGFDELFDWARDRLTDAFGELDARAESPTFPFPRTRTYARTMGENLERQFFFLKDTVPQDGLAAVKRRTLELEAEATRLRSWPVPRPINIDPGLLNDCRIILASTRDYAHRIYRADGIWEEITLIFRKGSWETLPWTYPDFAAPTYHEYFARRRKEHVRSLSRSR